MAGYRHWLVGLLGLSSFALTSPFAAVADTNPFCIALAGKMEAAADEDGLKKLSEDAKKASCPDVGRTIAEKLARVREDAVPQDPKPMVGGGAGKQSVYVTSPRPNERFSQPEIVKPIPPPPRPQPAPKVTTCPIGEAVGWIDVTRTERGDMFSETTQPILAGRELREGEVFAIPAERAARVHPFEFACELASECQWSEDRVSGLYQVVRIVSASRGGKTQRLQVCIRPSR